MRTVERKDLLSGCWGTLREMKTMERVEQSFSLRKQNGGFGFHCCCCCKSTQEKEETHLFLSGLWRCCLSDLTSLDLEGQALAPISSLLNSHGSHLCSQATPFLSESNPEVEDMPPPSFAYDPDSKYSKSSLLLHFSHKKIDMEELTVK